MTFPSSTDGEVKGEVSTDASNIERRRQSSASGGGCEVEIAVGTSEREGDLDCGSE
jgi:hypothetical protein